MVTVFAKFRIPSLIRDPLDQMLHAALADLKAREEQLRTKEKELSKLSHDVEVRERGPTKRRNSESHPYQPSICDNGHDLPPLRHDQPRKVKHPTYPSQLVSVAPLFPACGFRPKHRRLGY